MSLHRETWSKWLIFKPVSFLINHSLIWSNFTFILDRFFCNIYQAFSTDTIFFVKPRLYYEVISYPILCKTFWSIPHASLGRGEDFGENSSLEKKLSSFQTWIFFDSWSKWMSLKWPADISDSHILHVPSKLSLFNNRQKHAQFWMDTTRDELAWFSFLLLTALLLRLHKRTTFVEFH